MAEDNQPSFENILEELGMPGKYQLTQFAVITFSKNIATFMALSFVFLGYTPTHVCNPMNETSILLANGVQSESPYNAKYESCEIVLSPNRTEKAHGNDIVTSTCANGHDFPGRTATTFISEWDLVCENRGVAEWAQTIFVLGQLVGGLIINQITDIFGRRPVFLASTIAVFVLEWLVVASPSIYMIYVVKFFSGFFFLGVMITYLVAGMELLVPRHRQLFGVFVCFLWVFQVVVIGGVAYLLRDYNWRYLQGFIASCGVGCIFFPFIFNESPRWLAANNRRDETLAIIEKACAQNRKDFEKIKGLTISFINHNSTKSQALMPLVTTGDDDFKIEPEEIKAVKKQSLITLFRNRHLLLITFITWFIWATCSLTYYGLFMTSSSIAGNRFVNYILMGLVEIPSNFVILFMLNRMSRRLVLMIFMALSALAFLASSVFLHFGDASGGSAFIFSTALLIFGKFAIGSAFNIIFVYTPELFPTNLRCVGTGFCSAFGRIGSMVAPFLRPLHQIARWAPGIIFAAMCIITLFMIPFLPETKDKGLTDDIDDLKRQQKTKNKVWK